MSDLTRYRTEYGTPDDGNTLGEKEYNEGEDAYHQISQLIQDGYLVPDDTLQDIADAVRAYKEFNYEPFIESDDDVLENDPAHVLQALLDGLVNDE